MKIAEQRVNVQGRLLHRCIFHPDDGVAVRGAGLFYHGQGDYAERYADVLAPFTDHGIRCVVTDLPGHGYSPGRRGHCGDEALLDAIIADTLQSFGELPYVVMGHSMGGLLAARHLVLAGQGRLPAPAMAWLNAPLIHPGYGRSPTFLAIVRAIAPIFSEFTMSTGVTSAMCRVTDAEGRDSESDVVKKRPRHPLWHERISLGWAAVLLNAEKRLRESVGEIAPDLPILITQGASDPICPPTITREFFQQLPQSNKQYHEFEDGLHELFSGDGNQALSDVLNTWLDAQQPLESQA